jgi:tetraacyldisaccharide 4'-kinase
MVQNILVKILLTPFSLLYGLGVSLRNFFYSNGLLKSVEFNVPVISVGNLSVGGAGKTPHVEYLIRQLKDFIHVATLSRGYKRKTKGFLEIQPQFDAETAGDEPLQYKRKFQDISVHVSESRTFGIPEIMNRHPETQAILLDDAFQHRSVRPGLNILLTEYQHPFTEDYLLPSGRLREWRSAYKRADVIIISKCPPQLDPAEKDRWLEKIDPLPHQRLFFSYYEYGIPYYIFESRFQAKLSPDLDILLISAIARTEYLTHYLEERVNNIISLEFEDHHLFTRYDIGQLNKTFQHMENPKKIILTTEKDAIRMEMHRPYLIEQKLPILAIPVEVKFHFQEGPQFNELIQQYLLDFKV